MNLICLTDEALHCKTQVLVLEERRVTLEILRHLREVERRRLHAARGFSSLFDYATRELGYSEGAAQRRISSMRLLKEVPEIEAKIESGALSLSVVAQAQSFFKQETKSLEEKREVLTLLEGKSRREAERELASRSTQPARLMPDRFKAISSELVRVQFVANTELQSQFEEIRDLLAHAHPGLSFEGAVGQAFELLLLKLRPKAPKSSPPLAVGRVPTAEMKRQVYRRDGGRCTFTHDGRRCDSRYALEYDHIQPWALGGLTTVENLRLRCRTHNQWTQLELSKNSTRLSNGSLNSNRR